jgi:hypothetical protein
LDEDVQRGVEAGELVAVAEAEEHSFGQQRAQPFLAAEKGLSRKRQCESPV